MERIACKSKDEEVPASKSEVAKINLTFVKNGNILPRAKVIHRTNWVVSNVGYGLP